MTADKATKMNLLLRSSFVLVVGVFIRSTNCEQYGSVKQNPYYQSFIEARLKHLTAINDMKHMTNELKRHQLVVDLAKKIFKVLNESRKLRAKQGLVNVADLSVHDDTLQNIVDYMENTAFFCDLLVFFPVITSQLLDKNLLWRITLIDSIVDVMSLNATFVDGNTQSQFEKAYKILSEGIAVSEPRIEKKAKEVKKPKRGPRLTKNEL